MKFVEDINIVGSVEDANDPGVRINFRSTREKLSSRAEKVISDIVRLVRMSEQGQDYKQSPVYFDRYQPIIDAGTKEFRVKSISSYSVTL